MRKLLITMSGARYDSITEQVVRDAPKLGADDVLVYDDVWVAAHPFRQVNRWLWEHPGQRFPNGSYGRRGFGWYAFKPLIVLDALDRCEPGVVVVYLDGDSRPIADFSCVYDIARRDGAMFFASQGHKQATWCTSDCHAVMGIHKNSEKARAAHRYAGGAGDLVKAYYEAPAGCARFFAIRKGPWRPRQLVMEWLAYAVNPMATTFDWSELVLAEDPLKAGTIIPAEHEGMTEHRTEQAILSNLCHKHGYKLWREADESGEGWDQDRDVYGQLFQQTRLGDGSAAGGSRFRNVPMPEAW